MYQPLHAQPQPSQPLLTTTQHEHNRMTRHDIMRALGDGPSCPSPSPIIGEFFLNKFYCTILTTLLVMSDMHFWCSKKGRHPSWITYTQSVPIPAHTWLPTWVYKPVTSTRNTTTEHEPQNTTTWQWGGGRGQEGQGWGWAVVPIPIKVRFQI